MDQMRPQQSQNGPIQLHQPVAVAPRASIHGPQGILGNPAVSGNNAPPQMGGQAYPQQGQPMGPAFMNAQGSSQAAAQAAAAQGQGQQPILNVRGGTETSCIYC